MRKPDPLEVLRSMSAGEQSNLYRPGGVGAFVAEGIASALSDKAAVNLLSEGFLHRHDVSRRMNREDSTAYMAGFMQHFLTFDLRTNDDETINEDKEADLIEQAIAFRDGNENVDFAKGEYWRDTLLTLFDRLKSNYWTQFSMRDVQTVRHQRARGVKLALNAIEKTDRKSIKATFAAFDFNNIRILDIGGSAGFVNIPLIEDPELNVNRATVVDYPDLQSGVNGSNPWSRSNSTPIDSLSWESLNEYVRFESKVADLMATGNMEFIRLIKGQNITEVEDAIEHGKYNVFLLSTMLHQLTGEGREEIFSLIKRVAGNQPNWAVVVNDFAQLRPVLRDSLKYVRRWHGANNYATFVGGANMRTMGITSKQRLYHVANYKDSQCNNPSVTRRSL